MTGGDLAIGAAIGTVGCAFVDTARLSMMHEEVQLLHKTQMVGSLRLNFYYKDTI